MKTFLRYGGLFLSAFVLGAFIADSDSEPEKLEAPVPIIIDQGPIVLEAIKQKQQLVTATGSGQKTLEEELPRRTWIPSILNQDRIRLEAYGEVAAGFDFSQATGFRKGDQYIVSIGAPSIFWSKINNEHTRDARYIGWAASADPELSSQVRLQAERDIALAACQDGLLKEAEAGGVAFVKKVYALVGMQNVTVVTKPGHCV